MASKAVARRGAPPLPAVGSGGASPSWGEVTGARSRPPMVDRPCAPNGPRQAGKRHDPRHVYVGGPAPPSRLQCTRRRGRSGRQARSRCRRCVAGAEMRRPVVWSGLAVAHASAADLSRSFHVIRENNNFDWPLFLNISVHSFFSRGGGALTVTDFSSVALGLNHAETGQASSPDEYTPRVARTWTLRAERAGRRPCMAAVFSSFFVVICSTWCCVTHLYLRVSSFLLSPPRLPVLP